MDSKQTWGNHYETHSLYGHAESMVTYRYIYFNFEVDSLYGNAESMVTYYYI